MKINLRYFASVREQIGIASETIETSSRDLNELRNSKARYISALVNKDFIDGKHIFTFDFTRHRDNINLNAAKYSEYTPLTYAVSSPYPDYRIVKVLLHYGADPTLVNCDREGNHLYQVDPSGAYYGKFI